MASLRKALHSQGLGAGDLLSVGISCGGPLDSERGMIQAPPNLSSWSDVPICELLKQEFRAPCHLENDANAGALAEARFGAGRGCSNLIFLTMGTGLGAGLILNGQLYRGFSGAAGEIGHVRLTKRGPKGFGKRGSIEGWASGAGMAQVARIYARAAGRRGEPTLLLEQGPRSKQITGIEIAQAAVAGDRVAGEVVRRVGESLGETIAILVDLLNPECVLVGGLALRFGESLLGPAREVVSREALASSTKHCRILPAALGGADRRCGGPLCCGLRSRAGCKPSSSRLKQFPCCYAGAAGVSIWHFIKGKPRSTPVGPCTATGKMLYGALLRMVRFRVSALDNKVPGPASPLHPHERRRTRRVLSSTLEKACCSGWCSQRSIIAAAFCPKSATGCWITVTGGVTKVARAEIIETDQRDIVRDP